MKWLTSQDDSARKAKMTDGSRAANAFILLGKPFMMVSD